MSDLSGRAALDTTDFKAGLTEMNRDIRVIESSFRASAAALGDWGASATGLEQRIQALTAEISIQQQKVLAVRGEYERVAAEKGANSRAAEELQIRLNRETETLGKMEVELGRTQQSLAGMGGAAQQAGQQVQASTSGVGQALVVLRNSWTELASGIAVARQAFQAAQQAYEAIITPTLEYADQVRNLSRLIGENATQTSVLIEVADDARVEYDALNTAAEYAARQGIALNIDKLAHLADQYVALQDPVARAQLSTANFGKSAGPEMAKLLELGGTAIRQMANEAERTGKIMDDQAVAAAKRYQQQLQELTDRWDVLTVRIGTWALPALERIVVSLDAGEAGLERFGAAVLRTGLSIEALLAGIDGVSRRGIVLRGQYIETGTATDDLTASTAAMTAEVDLAAGALANARKALDDVAVAQDGVKVAWDQAAKQMQILNAALAGPLKRENESYAESQDKLRDKAADLEAEIAKLTRTQGRAYGPSKDLGKLQLEQAVAADNLAAAQKKLADAQAAGTENTNALQLAVANAQSKYDGLTGAISGASGGVIDNTTQLGKLQGQLDEVNGALEANAAKHEETTRRIIFGIIQQQLATDGFTAKETTYLTGLAERWGLLDHATAEVTKSIIEGVDKAQKDGSWDELDNRADYLVDKFDGGPGSVTYAAEHSAGAMAEMADAGVTALDKTKSHTDDLATAAGTARDRITETKDALLALPDNKTITLTTEHKDTYPDYKPGEGGGGQHFASGGQFRAGQKMIVAEKRREGIVPNFSGTVLSAETLDALERVLRTLAGTNLASSATAGAPAASGAGATTVSIVQHFYGRADPAAVGRAAQQSVREALRAEGRA